MGLLIPNDDESSTDLSSGTELRLPATVAVNNGVGNTLGLAAVALEG